VLSSCKIECSLEIARRGTAANQPTFNLTETRIATVPGKIRGVYYYPSELSHLAQILGSEVAMTAIGIWLRLSRVV
jgi:hypothetical protein